MSARAVILAAALAACSGSAVAQVDLTCRIPNVTALHYEEIPVVVTIENNTASPVAAGRDFEFGFSVTDERGNRIAPRDGQPVAVPTEIPPGRTVSFTTDVQRTHVIDSPGAYGIIARLALRERVKATPKSFVDVLPGTDHGSVDAQIPDGTMRRYMLRGLNRDKKDRLFLRIDAPDAGLCYGVVDLGRFIHLRPPVLRVDRLGRAHVLHLSSPNGFTHSVYGPGGEFVLQQFHAGEMRSIRLDPDGAGGYSVTGAGVTQPDDRVVDDLPLRRRL